MHPWQYRLALKAKLPESKRCSIIAADSPGKGAWARSRLALAVGRNSEACAAGSTRPDLEEMKEFQADTHNDSDVILVILA